MTEESNVKIFMDVTGTSEVTALNYLSAANNDLEVAINIHMESIATSSSAGSSTTGPSLPSSSTHSANTNIEHSSSSQLENIYDDEVRAPIAPRMDLMVNPEEDNFRVFRKRTAAKSIFVPLRDFDLEARRQEEQMTSSSSRATSSTGDSPKRRRLEDLFRPPVDLCYCGTFQSARDRATERNLWLIVNVQEHTEFACQVLNRDVWSNENVKDVIRKNFLFWQVSADSSEGNRFKTFYGVVTFPYVCIVDPRTGENKMQYSDIRENFDISLRSFLIQYPNPLSSPNGHNSRSSRPSSALGSAPLVDIDLASINMSEEDQLALAIKNSLRENNGASCSADTESENETDLESECDVAVAETYDQFLGKKEDEVTKISLRLPDGSREIIEWPCTSKIKALKLYISVQHPNIAKENYKMLTTFPNKDLNKLEEGMTLKEANLHPSAIVHIHIDDE